MKNIPDWTKSLRCDIIRMIATARSGHPGGSLSCIDMIAVLYDRVLKHDPRRPDWESRDRFILSKGHACPALYAVLADLGYFPKENLQSLRRLNALLQGHPDRSIPGIETAAGSLGQGLSIGLGMALAGQLASRAAKTTKAPWRVYVLLGDGEIQEGQCWEAIMAAPKFGLDNLTAIVDCNNGQIDGHVDQIMPIESLEEKFRSFHWETQTIDGHDPDQIQRAFDPARLAAGKPNAVLAKTIKGKGVSFMENDIQWHGQAPNEQQTQQALKEINA